MVTRDVYQVANLSWMNSQQLRVFQKLVLRSKQSPGENVHRASVHVGGVGNRAMIHSLESNTL
jgi:hypothetical protein